MHVGPTVLTHTCAPIGKASISGYPGSGSLTHLRLAVIADRRYLQTDPVTLPRNAFVNKTNKIFLLIQSPGRWWGGGSGKP